MKEPVLARQIVLMLIRRERRARRYCVQARRRGDSFVSHLFAAENEAHNAAELARRILYGHPL